MAAGDAFTVDMTAVNRFAADLGGVGARIRPTMKATVTKGALNVKNAAKQAILDQSRQAYVKQYPYSITYDLKVVGDVVSAEIGPDKDKPQGALGNLLEYGTPSNGGPYPHLNPALDAEEENTVTWLAKAAEDAVLGGSR